MPIPELTPEVRVEIRDPSEQTHDQRNAKAGPVIRRRSPVHSEETLQ